MAFVIPPNNRALGTPNPSGDMDNTSDMLGLYAALFAQQFGYGGHSTIPGDNATNVANILALLGRNVPWPGSTAWINATVPQYGADSSGAADSTAAINNALTAAYNLWPGTAVYLPAGIYKTSAPILIPPGGRLIGDGANEVSTYRDFLLGTVIQPSATWSAGTNPWIGVISVVGQTPGGYSRVSEEQKITGIHVDCHLMPGTTADGVYMYGDVARTHLERVSVSDAPHDGFGFDTDGAGNQPGGMRLYRCNVRYAGHHGFYIYRCSDISLFDCLVENAAGDGFNITNLSNGMIAFCRAEHNGASGVGNGLTFTCTNSSTGSGTAKIIGFSTDRNEGYGAVIQSNNNSGVPVQLVGCQFRRDGRNGNTGGATLAGLYVTAYPGMVMINGCAVWPGVDDSGTGTNSPQYGLKLAALDNSRTMIQVTGSYFQGNSAGISDDGSWAQLLYDSSTLAGAGPTGTPVVRGPRQGNASLTTGTVTVPCTAVTSTSRIFLAPSNSPASQGRLYISGLNPGVSFTVSSSSGTDSSSFAWQILNP